MNQYKLSFSSSHLFLFSLSLTGPPAVDPANEPWIIRISIGDFMSCKFDLVRCIRENYFSLMRRMKSRLQQLLQSEGHFRKRSFRKQFEVERNTCEGAMTLVSKTKPYMQTILVTLLIQLSLSHCLSLLHSCCAGDGISLRYHLRTSPSSVSFRGWNCD